MPIRKPSIFDIFEDFNRGFFRGDIEDLFEKPFEDMIKRFEEPVPAEFKDLVKEEKTPTGVIRRYGPFVYGFTYTAESGKKPVFQEFGNVRPSSRGILPSSGREPIVDVMDEKDRYKLFVELPGVDKENVKLDVAEDNVEIKTEDDKKFYKTIYLDSTIDPDSSKASFKNAF